MSRRAGLEIGWAGLASIVGMIGAMGGILASVCAFVLLVMASWLTFMVVANAISRRRRIK